MRLIFIHVEVRKEESLKIIYLVFVLCVICVIIKHI
jgi:heme/copper-type cytochrome/quinol oxidase subunit 4